ncbi:hypothetical protein H4P1_00047 (plasmid) [Variovorax sp. PBS-H4]|uniref:hypothetical protein n=1 Tax=Variovorax sp. PBS-H4 TaxID=434008 RepID=UPI0013199892|nr:hypothetical protein [Variovorax sp. PBS-H4]VTU41415.1 hypothetical protein H4P1_00047 [Variovorax sp. PBS-H4]
MTHEPPNPAIEPAGTAVADGITSADMFVGGAAILAAIVAIIGYAVQQNAGRRSERATLYGDAIGTVEAYLEAPYRIRRKIDDPNTWFAISSSISDTKASISHYQALLDMHAPASVATAFKNFADTAIREAGPQMTDAWGEPSVTRQTQIPLGQGYPRALSNGAREALVEAMSADLKKLWFRRIRAR